MINSPVSDQYSNQHIAQKTAWGFVWNFSAYFLGKIVVLITTSILARLLAKSDFGLVAVAVVAINYLSVLKDLGLGAALIQRKGSVQEAANTVFTINILIGLILSTAAILLAPLVAIYFRDPHITSVLRWMGISFIINALGSVHTNWLVRDLNYRRKLIPDLGGALIKGAISIGMAYLGYGVWSLVFGQIAGAIASVILVWIILPWRPRLQLDRKLATGLMKFGASVTAIDIMNEITDNIDYVIVGRIFGLIPLSIYTLAYRLPEMLLIGNLWVMGGVVFPAFSTVQDRPNELRRGFLASVRLVELIAVPICLGLLIAADPIVRVVFGDQWLDAIPILRVLAVYAWVYSLGYHVGGFYKAIGRPDILLRLSILTLIIIVPSLLIGAKFGIIGVAIGHLVAILIRRIISLGLAIRFVNVSIWDIFGELQSSFLAALVMAPIAITAAYLTLSLHPVLQLISIVLSGALSYIGVLWWIERENLMRLFRMVKISNASA
ncbi:MAG TPA: lipopolysaccharide biosynthesis protein [Anaerolineales bacterium]|nr:lipopolysaccharide biosynthesis protein [Anaerolineales bacterium]HLO28646.1 lipopolysaccharide biosynthesis protein [Anaerolineales bacterium]